MDLGEQTQRKMALMHSLQSRIPPHLEVVSAVYIFQHPLRHLAESEVMESDTEEEQPVEEDDEEVDNDQVVEEGDETGAEDDFEVVSEEVEDDDGNTQEIDIEEADQFEEEN